MNSPIRAAIVGAGHRALIYADHALQHPDEMQITAVADPDADRRRRTAETFHLPPEACFASADELAAAAPRVADVAINGTMDHQHVETSLPLLRAGYHLLLEKPFASDEAGLQQLASAARDHDRKVVICHVLRHAPFYSEIRRRVAAGAIGRLFNLQLAEHVSFHHTVVSYVRGKHRSKESCHASMLLAKCCHDIDLIVWMNGGTPPSSVSSFGSRSFFREDDGDTTGVSGGHGGGEAHLMSDFVRVVRGEPPSLSTTSLEDSIYGHLLCFAADRSMEEQRVVRIDD